MVSNGPRRCIQRNGCSGCARPVTVNVLAECVLIRMPRLLPCPVLGTRFFSTMRVVWQYVPLIPGDTSPEASMAELLDMLVLVRSLRRRVDISPAWSNIFLSDKVADLADFIEYSVLASHELSHTLMVVRKFTDTRHPLMALARLESTLRSMIARQEPYSSSNLRRG